MIATGEEAGYLQVKRIGARQFKLLLQGRSAHVPSRFWYTALSNLGRYAILPQLLPCVKNDRGE